MKISGANKPNFNPYQDQIQKQRTQKNDLNRKDQLEISSKAKQLQQGDHLDAKRATHVANIKSEIESGTYEINHDKIAQKMIDYWSKQ